MYLTSRLRVAGLRLALRLMKFPMPMSFVGAGSAQALCREIVGGGAKRLLLVTDAVLVKTGLVEPIVTTLRDAGVEVVVFDEIEPDPDYALIDRGLKCMRESRAQAVLAVGGGSSIDAAKILAACHANDCHPAKLVGLFKVRRAGAPLYAITTTAGTGSEVSVGAVVSDRQNQLKQVIVDPKLVPLAVALDPVLMLGLPPAITAATGMDALTHAVESYVSTLATEESDRLAREAVSSILRNLPLAHANGQDLVARERMAVAAFKAGLAMTRAALGYVHGIAHQLGALYHLPHGLANAIVLPHVLEMSRPQCDKRLADLARHCGLGDHAAGDATLAHVLIEHIRAMNRALGIPATVKELRPGDFDRITDRAFKEAHGTYGVPRYFTRTECRQLLARLMPDDTTVASC
jgi:alcohol dehydrogenase class IV